MCPTGQAPEPPENGNEATALTASLEESAEDLYENAPCGYLSTRLDGEIIKANVTLLTWLGYTRGQVVGQMHFTDLLTAGGKIYHETHFAPLLHMQGKLSGIALDLKTAAGSSLPGLVTSRVKTGSDGQPLLIRTTVIDAHERRSYEHELLRARRQAEEERQHVREVLATLQNSLLPPALPAVPGIEAAAHYYTASPDELGGDFYDLFPLGDGCWGFFLGDVRGKGPEAATVTSLARYTLRAAFLHDPHPLNALSTLNAALQEGHTEDDPSYCSVITGTFAADSESDTFHVTLASGGHPPALLLRADGSADYLPTPGGLLVGVLPQAHFASAATSLHPGDTLLLYTDGLTEARTDPNGGRYDDEALHAFATHLAPATAGQTITAITGLLDSFGSGLEDDTALLALGIPATPAGTENPV